MKKSIYALLFIHIIVFIVSCDKANDPDMGSGSQEYYSTTTQTVANDGCKSYYTRNLPAEHVELKTVSKNKLQITHVNTTLNCQPGKISFKSQAGDGTIIISEESSEHSANCVCYYDLSYIVEVPSYGIYKLQINSFDFGEFEFSANTNVKLNRYLTPNS